MPIGIRYRPDRQKWRADIWVNGKPVCLGHFDSEDEAISVYTENAALLGQDRFLGRCVSVEERFFSQIKKRHSGCIEWVGRIKQGGYGAMTVNGKERGTHRVSFELFIGEIPNGLWVLHRCDNPMCVNPAHLFLGTNTDNVADMVAKGRQAGALGERNHSAKLTASDVVAIRSERNLTQCQLAQRFGVSQNAISLIVRRKSWAHV